MISELVNYGACGIADTTELVDVLRNTPQVKVVHLSNNNIDDDGVAQIYDVLASSQVEQIYLNNNRITSKSLLLLTSIPSLTLLSVNGNKMLFDGFANLPSSKIETLHLRRCEIDSQTITLLCSCPNLKEVYLGQNTLEMTDIVALARSNLITLEICKINTPYAELLPALPELARSTSLQTLEISQNGLDDNGLEILLQSPHLLALDVNNNALTEIGIRKFLSIPNKIIDFRYHYNQKVSPELSKQISSKLKESIQDAIVCETNKNARISKYLLGWLTTQNLAQRVEKTEVDNTIPSSHLMC